VVFVFVHLYLLLPYLTSFCTSWSRRVGGSVCGVCVCAHVFASALLDELLHVLEQASGG